MERLNKKELLIQNYQTNKSRKPSRMAVMQACHHVFTYNQKSAHFINEKAHYIKAKWLKRLRQLPRNANNDLRRALEAKIRHCDDIINDLRTDVKMT